MDDASLAIFVRRSTLAIRAIQPVEKRWAYLARLHARLVADLRARRLDRDLARVHADLAIDAVLEALEGVTLQRPVPFRAPSGPAPRRRAVLPALSP